MADYTPKYVNPTEANRYGSKSTRITKPQSTAGAYQNVNAGEAQRYITSQNQLGGQTFNLRYGGVDYTLDQSQIGWMQDRYKKSFDSYYKNTVDDSQRLLSGAMPSAFERSYGNNQLDQQLYAMGLPSSKYLGSMMKDYSDWYGDGSTYQFDDQAKKYITDAYKKTWTYEYTTEDQARKVKGLMPLAAEKAYADSYTDEQLKKAGLPPSMKLSDFTTPYEERVATQNRIQDFYLAVGAEVFDMKARRGVGNDDKTYNGAMMDSKSGIGIGVDPAAKPKDQTPIETFTGTEAWQNAFYDMLEKPEWADVAALYKQTKTADDLDPGKYDDNAAYREARIKAINSENKAAASTDLAITYEDFINQYNTKLERQFRALKIVDDATAAAKGEPVTYGDYADAMDAQRKSDTYAGITDRATARQYAENAFAADPNADPSVILQGMYDGGVDFKHITQAKNRLYSLAKDNGATKEQLDALVGAYDTLNTTNIEKQQAAAKDAANKSTSFIDAALEYFVSGMLAQNAGTAQGSSRDIAMAASEEARQQASGTVQRAQDVAKVIRESAAYYSDVKNGYYGSAFTTVSKDDATKAYKSYIKYDGKNIDPDSLDAAKVALADMGLTNYEISVIEDEQGLTADDDKGAWSWLPETFDVYSTMESTSMLPPGTREKEALRTPEGKAQAEDMRNLIEIARKRATAEGIMTAYQFDQGVRVNGDGYLLDPTESAKNYWIEVVAAQSGVSAEDAALEWASLPDEVVKERTDWFSTNYMTDPNVAKSLDEVIAYQGIGSIAPKVIAGLAGSAVGLADAAVSIVDGRSDTWDFTKEVQEFTSFISNYGRTDQSLATQGISAASDIGAEIARMYLLNAAGGAIAGQTGLASTIQSAATSNGIRFLAKAGQFTAQSTPFILNAMGGYYNEAMQGGADIKQARQYALVMGALEGFTESWQTDAIWGKVLGKNMSASIAKSAGKTLSSGMLAKAKFINLAASFLGEATEEGASYAGSWLMSAKLQGWNDQPFSVEELANQALMGGFIGMLGGALSLPSMNEARITAEYMSKTGNYNTEYQDILVSAMFANSMPESFKEQAYAQGYKAILPIAEYKSAVENVNQSREQLKNGEKQHAQDMDAMKKDFDKKIRNSTNAELALDYLRADGVDPASEEFSRARANLIKFGRVSEVQAKQTAAVQKASDSYAAVKQQQQRAIEKSMEKVRAHHAVLADLFADDIAYMAEQTAADTADNQNYKQFAYAMQRIDELTQQGITSGAEYEAAVEALGQSQQLRDRIFDLRTKTENRGVTTPEKMRAARAGNAEEFVKKNKPANSKSKVINATGAEAKQTVSENVPPANNTVSETEKVTQTSAETMGGIGNITAGAMVGKKYLSEGKTAVSQFYENTLERMDTDEHTQEVRNAMDAFDEAFTYDVVSEKESIAKAKERLARGVTPDLIAELRSKNTWTGVDVDVAMAIKETYKQAGIETGNMDDYANWALLIADRVGENARALQALAKYTRDFKEIAITQMQRNVKKAEGKANKKTNDDIAAQTDEITKAIDDAIANGVTADELEKQIRKTVKKQTAQTIRDAFIKLQDGKIDRATFNKNLTDAIKVENGLPVITTEDATRVMELLDQADQQTDDYERRKYMSMAAKIIANTEGVTLGEKLRSFQRIQMLLNPRTMLRNVDANIVFTPVEWLKDVPATLADMIASKVTGERTTTVNVQKQSAWWQGLKRGTTEAVKDIKNGVNTGRASGKYEMANKDVWKSRFMQTLDNLVGYGLQAGDRPFYEAAYDEFMTNEKLLGHDIESDEVQQRVVGLALDRVFQGEPKLYDVVKGIRDTLDKSGVPFGTLLLPFTKTPANLADKLLDYSPAGLVKAAVQLGKSKTTGEFDQKQFVDRVGRSVTGTGLMILGYTLAKAGLIHGSGDDEKERQAMKNAGIAQYSLQLGDISVAINWAEPLGSILLMGAELAKSGANSESLNVLQGMYTGGKMLINSFFNNTVLSNVVSLFGGYGDIAGGLENFALGTSTQFLPSMLSAIARATDPYERDTYDPNAFLRQGKKILSYFPGLRQLLPFKYGTDGQIVESNYGETFFGRVFNSMLNPALTDKKSDDKVNSEIYRLYQGGFTDQLLPEAAKTISGVKLSAEQRRELQQMLGEATYNAAQNVIDSSWYRTMSDTEKADAISEAVSDAATDARAAFKANLK